MIEDISDFDLKNSKSYISKLADSLVSKAQLKSPPVMLNEILKVSGLKIKVICDDLGNDADGFSLGTKIIGYNSQSGLTRQRFTFAHELGHVLLGHNSDGIKRQIDLGSKDPKEKDANTFASFLLIPNLFLSKEKIEKESITSLAGKYNVSPETMKYRILNSKYIYKIKSLD